MTQTKSMRCAAFDVRIHIAGDYRDAMRICRDFCYRVGACVTCTPTEYIYTGGQESGVIVGFINYARFPDDPEGIVSKAVELGDLLMIGLNQHSFSVITPTESIWHSRRGDEVQP